MYLPYRALTKSKASSINQILILRTNIYSDHVMCCMYINCFLVVNYVRDKDVPPFFYTVMPTSMILWTGIILIVLICVFLALSTEKTRNKSFSVSNLIQTKQVQDYVTILQFLLQYTGADYCFSNTYWELCL